MSLIGRIFLALAGLVGLIYIVPAVLLYFWQDAILFPAPRISPERLAELAQQAGADEVFTETADGVRLYGWHLPASGTRAVLYFHGNGESVAYTRLIQQELHEAGWDFVCVSPRGYPGSGGAPEPGSLAMDARAAWDLITGPLGFQPGQIVVHGRSLGGGMAGTLMRDIQPAGLILESTFRSLIAIGRGAFPLYPVRLLLRHRAPSEDHAPSVTYPVLVLHGDQDNIVPPQHGRILAEQFPSVTFVEIQGFGHNDNLLQAAPRAHRAWRTYLDEHAP